MKKILILSSLLILLCGCSVRYEVYIDKDTIDENILLENVNSKILPQPAYYNVQGSSLTDEELDDIDYYEMTSLDNNVTLTYSFPYSSYHLSRALKSCYESVKFNRLEDNKYILNTSSNNTCFSYYDELDDILIKLVFSDEYNVLSNNADDVKDNTYSWQINKDNYKDKAMQIIFEKKPISNTEIDENKEKDEKKESWADKHSFLIIGLSFIFLVSVIFLIIILKRKRL